MMFPLIFHMCRECHMLIRTPIWGECEWMIIDHTQSWRGIQRKKNTRGFNKKKTFWKSTRTLSIHWKSGHFARSINDLWRIAAFRYGNDDSATTKRHSYNTSRNQRFSRHRNRDRLRQERHTIEAERIPLRYLEWRNFQVSGGFSAELAKIAFERRRFQWQIIIASSTTFRCRYHGTSMDRAHRMRQSYQRSHSIAPFENHSNENGRRRPDGSTRSYTMTLPASHGRHRSRINGDFFTLADIFFLSIFTFPHFFSFLFTSSHFFAFLLNSSHFYSFLLTSPSSLSLLLTSPPIFSRFLTQIHSLPPLLGAEARAQSVDPRIYKSKNEAPVLCNQYAIDALLRRKSECPPHGGGGGGVGDVEHRARSMSRPAMNRNKNLLSPSREPSADRQQHSMHNEHRSRYLAPPIIEYEATNECAAEVEVPVRKAKRRKGSHMPPSPRIMSPLGLAVYRQARLQHFEDDSIIIDDEWVEHASDSPVRPVPIWLCVFLVIGYIIGGAFYFSSTESWSFLDSAYFAFITLTTIVS